MGLIDNIFSKNPTERSNCSNNLSNESGKLKPGSFYEEVSVDLSSVIDNNDVAYCSDSGVKLNKIPNMIKIQYTGSLAQNGAQEIYAVVGYGDNNNWQDVEYIKMQKTKSNTFELLTLKKRSGNINMAFKDTANNWDNNMGDNYVFYDESYEGRH